MKLIVLNWIKDFVLKMLANLIEIIFRICLLILPMGLFLLIIQLRKGASKVSNITVYTDDTSVWQHIFPGFMLVSTNPNQFVTYFSKKRDSLQEWINKNKYLLASLAVLGIVAVMVVKG